MGLRFWHLRMVKCFGIVYLYDSSNCCLNVFYYRGLNSFWIGNALFIGVERIRIFVIRIRIYLKRCSMLIIFINNLRDDTYLAAISRCHGTKFRKKFLKVFSGTFVIKFYVRRFRIFFIHSFWASYVVKIRRKRNLILIALTSINCNV